MRICTREEPGQGDRVSHLAELEKPDVSPASNRLPGRLWLLLFVLAAIQFTNIVDFLIMMPLGPQFMRIFEISPGQFGFVVSAYAFSAGLSGVAAAFFLDRFDRRTAILALYAGLTLGALLCGLAPNFPALVAARIFTGVFGGVIGAAVLSATGDLIPGSHRGRAMGIIMSSFSMAAVLGVPLGLELAERGGWHTPFFFLAGVGTLIWLIAARLLPPMRGHMTGAAQVRPQPMQQIREIIAPANHRRAYALMASLTLAGISVVPYLSAYVVANTGFLESDLKWIYLIGGGCTLVSMNVIGRVADFHGKFKTFAVVASLSIVTTLTLTHLPVIPKVWLLTTTSCFMVFMSGRFIPAMAMITSSAEPRLRGGFMSLNTSVQQFASAFAALGSGLIIGQAPDGKLTGYGTIGFISAGLVIVSILLASRLRRESSAAVDFVPRKK
jgi:predicted MFS family arabinose efflux permease